MSDKARVFETVSARNFSFGFGVRNSEEAESVLKLGLFEGAPCSRCEVGLCTVPRMTIQSAEMVDEINVHSVSGVLLEFLSLRPVSLRLSPLGE